MHVGKLCFNIFKIHIKINLFLSFSAPFYHLSLKKVCCIPSSVGLGIGTYFCIVSPLHVCHKL